MKCCKGEILPLHLSVLLVLLLLQRPLVSGASSLRESYSVHGARSQSGGGAHGSAIVGWRKVDKK